MVFFVIIDLGLALISFLDLHYPAAVEAVGITIKLLLILQIIEALSSHAILDLDSTFV